MAERVDQELQRLIYNDHVRKDVARALRGKSCTVLLVGVAGAGKSSLVNSLLLRQVCATGTSAKSITKTVQRTPVEMDLDGHGTCILNVIDSPGYIGLTKEDEQTKKQLQAIGSFDVLLCCFDCQASGSRYPTGEHLNTLRWLKTIFKEDLLRSKCIIVLTKGNKVEVQQAAPALSSQSELQDDAAQSQNTLPVSVDALYKDFIQQQKEVFEEEGLEKFVDLPIYMAGLVTFREDHKPKEATPIDGSEAWFDELWNGCIDRAGRESSLGIMLFHFSQKISHEAPWFKPPRPNENTLVTLLSLFGYSVAFSAVGAAVLPVAVAASPFVAGVYGIKRLHAYIKARHSKKRLERSQR